MKTNQIYIQFLTVFLLGHTSTCTGTAATTCDSRIRSIITSNVAVGNVVNILPQQLPRGGGGDNDDDDSSLLTKQQQRPNTTKIVSEDDDTSSWLNKLRLRQRNRNQNNNSTTTTSTRKDDATDNNADNTKVTGSSPIVQTSNTESNKTGWFQQRQPWRNRSNNSSSGVTTTSSKQTEVSTKRKGWGRRRNPTKKELDENSMNNTSANSSTPIVSSTTNSTSTIVANTETSRSDGNHTNTSSPPEEPPSPQQIVTPNSGMIVIGPGLVQPQSHPSQYYRGQPVIIRGTSSSSTTNPTGMTPNPTNSLAIVLIELFSVVLGKVMYLWFFTWLAKHLAQQEEGIIMPTQHYVWERLNDRYSRDAVALQTVIREPPLGVSYKRWYRQHIRQVQRSNRHQSSQSKLITPKLAETFTRTVVVVELSESGGSSFMSSEGSSMGGSTISLKAMPDVVSFLLQQQRQHAFGTSKVTGDAMPLEVVFIVNSPGGEASKYGLAAAQMRRLKNQLNITTTVCVDKYAASGGYMIASQADKLVAAPFATIGSVGVIVEGLNFYELAKRYGVQPLVLKAGESKNPLSQWGPVTRQDLAQEQKQLEKVHEAFKEFVTEGRPGLIATTQQVMDGSVYLGLEAKGLGLIDVIMTTDEYIFDRIEAGDRVLRLHRSQQGLFDRSLRFSPLDVLPHLRSWLSKTLHYFVDRNDRYM